MALMLSTVCKGPKIPEESNPNRG